MDLYPKQPEMDKPPVIAGIILVVFQILTGILMLALGSLVRVQTGSSLSMVGGMVAAMSYAAWLERKGPGALAKRSMSLWLSGIAMAVQMLLALVYVGLLSLAAREDGGIQLPPVGFLLIVIPIAGAIFFAATWFGLWQGRRIIEKQRAKAPTNNPPPAP